MPDATVIQIEEHVSSGVDSEEFAERQILLVECKRPSQDTPLGWNDTIQGQFQDDLQQTLNGSERLFGAVAIGTKLKFYRFDGHAGLGNYLSPLHQGTLDLSESGDLPEIERMLNYIKANGWQWAS